MRLGWVSFLAVNANTQATRIKITRIIMDYTGFRLGNTVQGIQLVEILLTNMNN